MKLFITESRDITGYTLADAVKASGCEIIAEDVERFLGRADFACISEL